MGKNPNIFHATEVFPKFCAYDVIAAELHINGYDCFSTFSHHVRGIYIYIKSKYKAHKVETISAQFQVVVWCSILLKDTHSYSIVGSNAKIS